MPHVGNDILNQVKGSTDFPQGFGNQISKNVALNSARLINAAGQPTNINDPDGSCCQSRIQMFRCLNKAPTSVTPVYLILIQWKTVLFSGAET